MPQAITSWKTERISRLLETIEIENPSRDYPTKEFLYVDISGIDGAQGEIKEWRRVLGRDAPSRARQKIKRDDVLVSTVRPNLNATAIVPAALDSQICSTGFCVLRSNGAILPRYLYFFTRTPYFVKTLSSLTRGASYPAVTKDDVEQIQVPLPPIEIQRKLSSILDKVQGLGQRRRQANELTNEIIQSVFLKMFGDPVSNERHWSVSSIRDAAERVSDGPFGSNLKTEHYTTQGVRVIRLQNIGVGEFLDDDKVFISTEHYTSLRKHTCIPGDVIVGTLGDPNLRACILPDYVQVAVNKADCILVRPREDYLNARYLCHLLNTPQMLHYASSYIHGETRTRISMSQVASLQIPIPPLATQERFAQAVGHFDQLHSAQKRADEEINELFRSLRQRAFSGELTTTRLSSEHVE